MTEINTAIFQFEPQPQQEPITKEGLMLNASSLLGSSSPNLDAKDLFGMLSTLAPLPPNIAASSRSVLNTLQSNPYEYLFQPQATVISSLRRETGLSVEDATVLYNWIQTRMALYSTFVQLTKSYQESVTQNSDTTITKEYSAEILGNEFSFETSKTTTSAYGNKMMDQSSKALEVASELFFAAETRQFQSTSFLVNLTQSALVMPMLMSQLLAMVSVNPSQYKLSSPNVDSLINNLTAKSANQPSDTDFSKFVSIITNYRVSNSRAPPPAPNPLDSILNTLYADTIEPTLINVNNTVNFVDPSHANVPAPDYSLIQQEFDVNLNSTQNQILYNQLIQQYAIDNNLSPELLAQLQRAKIDPAYNNPWAQKVQMKILAQLLATLINQGEINITETMYKRMLAQLPPSVQKEIGSMKTDLKDMTAILGAILIAGATQIDSLSDTVSGIGRLNQFAEFNGAVIMGATTALNNIMHPDAVNLLDFLGTIAKFTLDYRNEQMKIMMMDVEINQASNIAKRDMIQSQMQQIEKAIEAHFKQFAKYDAMMKALKSGGIGMIIGGALLAAFGAMVAAGFAWTGAGVAGGAALVAMGAGMIAGGGMMLAASEGKDLGTAAMKGMGDKEKNAMMGGMIAMTVAAAILTVLSLGAASPLLAVAGASLGTVTAAVSSAIWGSRVQELIAKDLRENQGMNEKDSAITGAAMVALINLAIVAFSLGAAAPGQVARTVSESVASIARTMSTVASQSLTKTAQSASEAMMRMMQSIGKSMLSFLSGGSSGASRSVSSSAASAMQGLKSLFNFAGEQGSKNAVNLLMVTATLVSAAFEAASSITSAKYEKASAESMKVQAMLNELQILISTCMNVMSQMVNALSSGEAAVMKQVNDMSQNFQECVQNLMQAVTAITSNQAAPTAAATGGGGPPKESSSTQASTSENKSKEISLEDVIVTSSPNVTSGFAISGVSADGLESSFMGTATKPRDMAALLTLMRALGKAIGEMLQQAGLPPNIADGMGMKMAGDIMMQMKMLAAGHLDNSKAAQEAMSKNPLLLTLTLLMHKKGISEKDFDLQKLMMASPDSNVLDDATMGELLKMMEELAKNDPELQSLLGKLKRLMERKSSNASEFSFAVLELFTEELEMKSFNFDGLETLMGPSMEGDPALAMLKSNDEDLGDLINEYFIQGSTESTDSEVAV